MNKITNDHARFAKGLSDIVDLVGSTMGDSGAHVTICGGKKGPVSTNDGARVVEYYTPDDPLEAEAVRRVRSACDSTVAKAGDGTSTTAVLLRALYEEGMAAVEKNHPRHLVVQGMRKVVATAIGQLKALSIPAVENEKGNIDLVTKVVTIAMHGDVESASKVAELVCGIGINGSVIVENAKGSVLETERIDGLSWAAGVQDVSFFTEAKAAKYDESWLLVCNRELDDVESVSRVLEVWQQACKAMNAIKPLIIVCPEISGSARMILTRRQLAGSGAIMPICVVGVPKHPMFEEMLSDLVAMAGGTLFDPKRGTPLDQFEDISDFGNISKVVAMRDRTTFLPVEARSQAMAEHIAKLKEMADVEKDGEIEATLRNRIASISGGVGVIRVPVLTGGDYSDKVELYQDAYMAAFSAMSDGVLPGGGTALARIGKSDSIIVDNAMVGDKSTPHVIAGMRAAARALADPMAQILNNSGQKYAADIIDHICKDPGDNLVLDLRTGEVGDAVKLGVLDSVRVVCTALENAAAEACLLVMTKNFVYQEKSV